MAKKLHTKPDNLVAKSGLFAGANTFMGIASTLMIVGFVVFTVWDVDYSGKIFELGKGFVISTLDWFYVAVVSAVLFFVLWLMFSRFGSVRLSKDDEKPEFSTFSWICMLFSAGLASGLIYWGVAEPMYHIQGNPFMAREGVEPNSVDAAIIAIRITIFHWGLHGWALYVLVGLSLAYFAYRKGLPLSLRTALYPILKDRIYGFWGHVVDLICVFGTIFGLATSLGLGVVAIANGLGNLGWLANTTTNQLVLIALITAVGTGSAVSGVNKGIRILSEWNVWVSLGLLLIFLVLGPTEFILGMVVSSAGDYLWNVIPMGFWVNTEPGDDWQSWWTVFYWGWWVAWCPFVGMFIARISKGRTIREFCLCVLLVPTSVVIVWMGVFGGAAVGVDLLRDAGVSEAVNADYASGVFQTVAGFGYESLVTPITILITLLLVSWFVTSSDSGTLVMATMLSMGNESPPIRFRLFWGITSGVVAGILLRIGGLSALQTASIVAGVPLAVMLVFMGYGMVKTLHEDFPVRDVRDKREKEYLNR